MRCGADGLIKIGKAIDPHRRLQQLQTGSGETLTLMATEPGGFDVEWSRHRQFRAMRVRGEWFRADPVLLQHIEALRAGRGTLQPWALGWALGGALSRCGAGLLALCTGLLAGWSGEAPMPGAHRAGRYVGRRVRSSLLYMSALLARSWSHARVLRRASRG
jgi:hypothetical protein